MSRHRYDAPGPVAAYAPARQTSRPGADWRQRRRAQRRIQFFNITSTWASYLRRCQYVNLGRLNLAPSRIATRSRLM